MLNVAAIVPVMRPRADRLHAALAAISPQVRSCLLYDNNNTDGKLASFCRLPNIRIIGRTPEGNKGTARAFNEGAAVAEQMGHEAILLLDQDSVPETDMVRRLEEARRESVGCRVAAVGPRYHQPDTGNFPGFVRFSSWGIRRVQPGPGEKTLNCDFLIASGMLIPLDTFRDVGPMDEGLFVDHVDTEWCLRARSMGYKLLGVRDAVMEHELGSRRKSIWFGRRRSIPVHSPERYYGIARNSMVLHRRPYMDARWKRHDLARLIGLFFFNGVFALPSGGKTVAWQLLVGIRHGLRSGEGAAQPFHAHH
jgi:rhamnosyltransferase